jgi:hypothetical protein
MGKFVGWVLVAMACGGVALAAGGGKAGCKFTFFLCGAIGASIVVSAVTTGPGPLWLGYPGLRSMPRPPRMRRRLVYRMP